jgi:hypothetical protein
MAYEVCAEDGETAEAKKLGDGTPGRGDSLGKGTEKWHIPRGQ